MLRQAKKKKDKKSKKAKAPAGPAPAIDPVSIVVTDAEIIRAQGAEVERLRLDAIDAIVVRSAATADDGHDLHWVLSHAEGAMVVPDAADGADELSGRLQRFDGFDGEALVQAAASAADASFDCWSRPGG